MIPQIYFDLAIYYAAICIIYFILSAIFQLKVIKIEDLPFGEFIPSSYCPTCLTLLFSPIILLTYTGISRELLFITLGMGVYAFISGIIAFLREDAKKNNLPTTYIKEKVVGKMLLVLGFGLLFFEAIEWLK